MSRPKAAALWLLPIGFFVAAPLLWLLADVAARIAGGGDGSGLFALALPTGRRLGLFVNSLGFSTAVAAGSIALGIPAALWLHRLRSRLGGALTAIFLLTAAVPSYVYALSWTTAFEAAGIQDVSGFAAAWWVELTAMLPFAAGIVLLGLHALDREHVDAARPMRSDAYIFFKIVLPEIRAFIITAAGFVFLYTLVDYSIPSLFRVNTYPLEIFAQYSSDYDPAAAFMLNVPLLATAVLLIFAVFPSVKNIASASAPSRLRGEARIRFGFPLAARLVMHAAGAAVMVHIAVPLVSLTAATGSITNFIGSVAFSFDEIKNTLLIAAGAALAGVLFAGAAAKAIYKGNFPDAAIYGPMLALSLVLPSPLIGAALIGFWQLPGLSALYGTIVMPVLAGLIRFLPFGTAVVYARLKLLDPLHLDAARVFRKNALHSLFKVYIPMAWPALFAAGCVMFVLTAGELGATILAVPPGTETLTVKIYNYLHYGRSDVVAGLCLAMLAATMLAMVPAFLAFRGRKKR